MLCDFPFALRIIITILRNITSFFFRKKLATNHKLINEREFIAICLNRSHLHKTVRSQSATQHLITLAFIDSNQPLDIIGSKFIIIIHKWLNFPHIYFDTKLRTSAHLVTIHFRLLNCFVYSFHLISCQHDCSIGKLRTCLLLAIG